MNPKKETMKGKIGEMRRECGRTGLIEAKKRMIRKGLSEKLVKP